MAETITLEELKSALDEGSVVVLEALPPEYFEKEHIVGAHNLPLDDIDTLAPELVPDKEQAIVTYCSNTSCNNSTVAAERLHSLGYRNVRTFAGGKEEWTGAGLPLSHG
ncbi:MAG: rhodanese-like domain-containing protein [Actinomycetota bacterium]|nr:rhodanese-like domain-containing protein [Actinomycetota bacterium]MDQ3574204.1 rhodanese-like domain-containing protein [Actinomycetota bacterium]